MYMTAHFLSWYRHFNDKCVCVWSFDILFYIPFNYTLYKNHGFWLVNSRCIFRVFSWFISFIFTAAEVFALGRFEVFPSAGTVVLFRFVMSDSGWSIPNEFGGLRHVFAKTQREQKLNPLHRNTSGFTPYIRSMDFDWLIAGEFFVYFHDSFRSFLPLPRYLHEDLTFFPSVPWYLRKRISLFYPRVPQTAKFIRDISSLSLYVR
jgi:hypothetical protein